MGFDVAVRVGSFDLTVAHPAGGHRLAILGPSGSGKSLTLRALAGLLGPGVGTVTRGDTDISRLAPEARRLGYVPQGLGLMPHQTVWQQATFGVDADPARAAWWLSTLRLDGLGDRYPDELSGGQRQRVSLARALSGGPSVVLLDEPFSALDAPVRDELRRELRRLQREAGLSTVLVTHDPEEAALLADEILVVADGRVLQAGPLTEVYRQPASAQVARLLGATNISEGVVGRDGGVLAGSVTVAGGTQLPVGAAVSWSVAPERVEITGVEGPAVHPAVVTDVIDLGTIVEVTVRLNDGPVLRSRSTARVISATGERCLVRLDPADVRVWLA
jgi:molybdate transport system permease protein